MTPLTESDVELAVIDILLECGYDYIHGGVIAPDERLAERGSYEEVLLVELLRRSLENINQHIPPASRQQAIEEAVIKIQRVPSQNPIINNHAFHQLLIEGVDVSFRHKGVQVHEKIHLIDFANPNNNHWLAVNQFTITGVHERTRVRTERRPDVVLFVNGIPMVIIELKNVGDERATLDKAFQQLQTYREDIGAIFTYNALLAISDGFEAKLGTLTSGWEWYKPWRTVDGETLDPYPAQIETLIRGVFAPEHFLDLIRWFIVFEQDEQHIIKKVAAYHQRHAVNKAVENTIIATRQTGDGRVGVVWHTQGSGKSLSMLFYAGKVILHPAMGNPTVIVLTDRNDLDDQLFGVFAGGQELLRQEPVQANNRDHLKALLQVASGGVIFTTIQKFLPDDTGEFPLLSERHNIVFIADEAHRSQYGFEARVIQRKDSAYIGYGFAKYVRDALPNASFIGFTGTPVESSDANTAQVFGDYIDIYDIQRAVGDGATVPIYYEARLAMLRLNENQRPQVDASFEELTEGEEEDFKEQLKTKWSQLEAMVGTEERLSQVAQDLVTHFESRLETLDGKAMIVCMSRRIAVDLYDQIIKIRPEWHDDRDDAGFIKVVMTGNATDPAPYQAHIRNKPRRKALSERFKEPTDSLKLVIVRDMWLTGFDAPVLHTMYIDKPMHGHNLMQAIARVNRVFRDKPGGLIVDYLGIAEDLQKAINVYTASKGKGSPADLIQQAIDIMLTEYGIVKAFFHRFDYSLFFTGTPLQRLNLIPAAMEHVLKQHDGKKRFMDAVTRLSKAYALAKNSDAAEDIRDDVAFFQTIRATLVKTSGTHTRTHAEVESAVKQIVSKAVVSEGIVDLFRSAGLSSPNVAILSDEFLDDMRHLPYKNLAVEVLQKLINDQIRSRLKNNVVRSRSFIALLEDAIKRYQNRSLEPKEIVELLIDLAKEINTAQQRGDELGLSADEVAFYDALAYNKSAVDVMGDKQLAIIALELVKSIKNKVTIDWTVKQSARANIRIAIKRILRKYGYPPDLEESAADAVIEQAEQLAANWAQD